MNDQSDFDPEGDELIAIDARSPGERWADSGRAGWNDMLERQRLDLAAMVWMICLWLITGTQIYSAVRMNFDDFSNSDWWARVAGFSQSGGIVLAFGSAVAIALALQQDSLLARRSLLLATVGGLWVIAAGFMGVAVSFHQETAPISLSNGGESKFVSALLYVGFAGLGLVITIIAGRCANAMRGRLALR
jgi:hypothetical protein